MTKYVQTKDELLGHLKNQIEFMKKSASSYDSGFEGEAQRLAVSIRVLVHDTQQSKSLLMQLNKKDVKFYDSALTYNPCLVSTHQSVEGISKIDYGSCQPDTSRPFSGLTITNHSAKEASHVARLDSSTSPTKSWARRIAFNEWWEGMFVIRDGRGKTYTRKDLVLETADTDGGAHVDPNLDEAYAGLSRFNSLGWKFVKNTMVYDFKNNPVSPSVRQIAHEVLITLKQEFPNLF